MAFEKIRLSSETADWRNLREGLKKELAKEAAELRQRGFLVDDECRIDPAAFREFLGKTKSLSYVADEDLARVQQLEKRQVQKEAGQSSERQLEGIKGEILEMNKTLAFNRSWFGKRLIAVRTAKYDDFENHVDQLILDFETGLPFAAVDITTDWKIKAQSSDFSQRIQKGNQVRYGFELDAKKQVQKKSYQNLPLFIIAVPVENASDFNSGVFQKKEKTILQNLKKQAEQFSQIANPEVRLGYEQASRIFGELLG